MVLSGALLLGGGGGIPGVVSRGEPGFAPTLDWWVLATATGLSLFGGVGTWIGWLMQRPSRRIYHGAIVFCAAGIALGLVWALFATTPVPGILTSSCNTAILLGLAAFPESRRALRGELGVGGGRDR